MGARRGTAGAAGMLVMAALVACTGSETAEPPAVVAAAPATTVAAAPPPAPTTTVAPAPAAAESALPPTGAAHLPAGVHEHHLDVDGIARRWTTVVPGGGPPTGVVVVLHGVGGRGADMRSAGFEPLAAARSVVVAYPDAHGGAWNDGRPGADPVVPGPPADDGRFLRALVEETVARTGADPRRVAIVGFSSGAVMASRLACDVADHVAAIALVAGTAGQGFERSCRPARPMAVMLAAGVSDQVVPYAGGRIANWGTKRRGYVAGVEEVFTFWRSQNGCASTQVAGGEAQGTDCRSPVVRYRVTGAAHEWYRAPRFDTTNVVWDVVFRRFTTAV